MRANTVWIRSVGPLAAADLRHRYAGSWLGGLWAVAAPLLEVAAYAVVFGFLVPPSSSRAGLSYAVFIAAGLLPWTALREALEGSAAALPDNRWIRRSRVPMELLVARQVLVSVSRAVVGLLLVLGVAAGAHGPAAALAGIAFPLVALVLQVAGSFGLGLAIAPLATLYPDLRAGLASILTLLTFASPILYPESLLGPHAMSFVEWNPFTHFLRLYRVPLAGGSFGSAMADLAFAGASAAVLLLAGTLVKGRLWWAARDRL